MPPPTADFQVAIIGGGLTGLLLSIALSIRQIPYTLYESRPTFTEIGAGINLGPNARNAMGLIYEALLEKVKDLATRNPKGKEDVWFQFRLGAATGTGRFKEGDGDGNEDEEEKDPLKGGIGFRDGELLEEFRATGSGNMALHRQELLACLAEVVAGMEEEEGQDKGQEEENKTRSGEGERKKEMKGAKFNKRLERISQDSTGVILKFTDGTEERASIAIGCDGIHSKVREIIMGGPDTPGSGPTYSGHIAYRALLPAEKVRGVLGEDMGSTSQFFLGPKGYSLLYPISGGTLFNFGLWFKKPEPWGRKEYMIEHMKDQCLEDSKEWGESMKGILNLFEDTGLWATFYHDVEPVSYFKGRVMVIGDGAHAMPPHQGAGAGQATEDAYVLSEVLQDMMGMGDGISFPSNEQISAAFGGYESVRKPRAQKILETSQSAMDYWTEWWREDLTENDVGDLKRHLEERFFWIWKDDIKSQVDRAKIAMDERLQSGTSKL